MSLAIMPSMKPCGSGVRALQAQSWIGAQVRIMAVKSEYAHDLLRELSVGLVLDDRMWAWVLVVLDEMCRTDLHELRLLLQQDEQVRHCGLASRGHYDLFRVAVVVCLA